MAKTIQTSLTAIVLMFLGGFLYFTTEHLMGNVSTTTPTISFRPEVMSSSDVRAKTRVLRHDGQTLKALTDFCTWTVPLDCAMMKTASGPLPIYIHRVADDVYVSGQIVKTGSWEPDKMKSIFSELDKYPNAGFIDIGAHIGSYSLQAARMGRTVLAVDPLIENVQRLCKSVQRNGFTDRLTVVFNPLSDARSLVTFRKSSANIGATRVVTNSKHANITTGCDDAFPTYTVMLDELLSLATFKTAIIKMDVEEHEYRVMKGGLKFLRDIHVPVIFMEWVNVKDIDGKPLLELMKTLKYIPFSPSNKNVPLKDGDYLNWPYDVVWVKHS